MESCEPGCQGASLTPRSVPPTAADKPQPTCGGFWGWLEGSSDVIEA